MQPLTYYYRQGQKHYVNLGLEYQAFSSKPWFSFALLSDVTEQAYIPTLLITDSKSKKKETQIQGEFLKGEAQCQT